MITTVVFSVALVLFTSSLFYFTKKHHETLSKFTDIEVALRNQRSLLKKITTEIKSLKKMYKKQTITIDTPPRSSRTIVSKETVKDLIGELESEGFLSKNGKHSAKDIIIIQEFIHPNDFEETEIEDLTVILDEARELVKATGVASITHLGKTLEISKEDAETILDRLEEEGIVGPSDGSSHRTVFKRE